jgi:aerobic C4-dicarboxylate transport protein
VLQVVLLAILFGFALHAVGGRDNPLFRIVEEGGQVFFRIVGYVMRLAPLGALGAMAFTVGRFGLESLLGLAGLMACFYLTCIVFVLGVLGLIARLHGFSVLRFIRYIREELLVVLGTSSSESVLPRMLHKMEDLGVRKSIVGLVIPAGYSFNLDGTSIYLTMAAIYIAQATNTPLDIWHQLTLLAVLLLTSKGAAAVTGGGFITLAASLAAVGHVPVVGLALILGVDRFMSEARALTNLVGNGVATIVVGKWCGAVDEAKLHATLGGEEQPQLPSPSAP